MNLDDEIFKIKFVMQFIVHNEALIKIEKYTPPKIIHLKFVNKVQKFILLALFNKNFC